MVARVYGVYSLMVKPSLFKNTSTSLQSCWNDPPAFGARAVEGSVVQLLDQEDACSVKAMQL